MQSFCDLEPDYPRTAARAPHPPQQTDLLLVWLREQLLAGQRPPAPTHPIAPAHERLAT